MQNEQKNSAIGGKESLLPAEKGNRLLKKIRYVIEKAFTAPERASDFRGFGEGYRKRGFPLPKEEREVEIAVKERLRETVSRKLYRLVAELKVKSEIEAASKIEENIDHHINLILEIAAGFSFPMRVLFSEERVNEFLEELEDKLALVWRPTEVPIEVKLNGSLSINLAEYYTDSQVKGSEPEYFLLPSQHVVPLAPTIGALMNGIEEGAHFLDLLLIKWSKVRQKNLREYIGREQLLSGEVTVKMRMDQPLEQRTHIFQQLYVKEYLDKSGYLPQPIAPYFRTTK